MSQPSISVVCPIYNSAAYIESTLRSVLTQTLTPLELIVSDDGSHDRSCEIVEALFCSSKIQTTLLRNQHHGPGAARNAGIRAASGTWIAFLDSDDRWKPNKLEVVEQAIASQPDKNFFCHNETHIGLDGTQRTLDYALHFLPGATLPAQLYRRCLFSTSAVVCRKDLLLAHGMFDENLMSSQDYELWLRLSPHLQVHFIPEVLGYYQDRAGNITSGNFHRRMMNLLRVHIRHLDKASPAIALEAILRWLFNYGPRRLLRWAGYAR
ncbi:MAG: glycosyltransferase family 2 protein [Oligoflexia bacterium]|nr:glycosyltransferase family 2 protein [Oligoflexia bacterium]